MADGTGGNPVMRVMIVEDNEALAQTTGWLVEMLGYDYRLALSPKQAQDQVVAYRPDVIMMDLGLPGMNGYNLCRLLRKEPELADTVFIAQTGWGEAEHRRLTNEAGFHHHLVKPLYLEALKDLLASIEKTLHKTPAER
ncbi:histidine kinase [Asticcacaulis sp. AC402]|nr:histidine kinase [Asticcacaulis sp. AC402]